MAPVPATLGSHEAQAKIEAATKSLKQHADPAGIGVKLLAKMGFGVKGSGLGREGQVRVPLLSAGASLLFLVCIFALSLIG